ncbi:deoxyribodipyrimidine photo-lyase [Sphingorhabdus sp. Alg239-R122]|uniref:cryptochrome/photolyase family protein n=1 Tax=Sphingorhabdus sp. Alg239-R122 TaxID=2305989 RepID=UPI0013DD26CF|nr:deoxyribodipyrimidine photo-lyase [Sphingorhabdus sp. Alg239-R122]
MTKPVILWFRRDLRLSDQAAVRAAAENASVIPVYVLDEKTPRHRKMGAASLWWLHHSLASLDESLRQIGSRLILRRGVASDILADIAHETDASEIHALRHYEPWWRNSERTLKQQLGDGCELVLHDGNYLMPPGSVTTGSGDPYKIYTPFWKTLREYMPPAEAVRAPVSIESPADWPISDVLDDWKLLPKNPDWAGGFAKAWAPGEDGARDNIESFIDKATGYDDGRNLPSQERTSRLSPHLHFGEVSPACVWHRVSGHGQDVTTYHKELVWRDYAQNVIVQYPEYGAKNARDRFGNMPWRDFRSSTVRDEFDAWCRGQTGYPIVDAGMRELWSTGWMHNRVRMIAASFLVKHLLIDWREGEKWFWDTLVDADYASNATNWQWVAGTGIDSNMFVRIMAPLSQSEKFDAGDYIRTWVPELADLDDPYVHDPEAHGCRPDSYPAKLIGHKAARQRALQAYQKVKG